jgi:YesN/AraC family two-component response regulator
MRRFIERLIYQKWFYAFLAVVLWLYVWTDKVLTASNCVEALMIYSSYHARVDLVLTDVQIPRTNGIELSARIRAHNSKSRFSC